MKKILKSFISVFLCILLIIHPDVVISSATDALNTCFTVLLPSLFPFFVLSRIFISSGGAGLLGKIFNFIMLPLFRINGSGTTAFVLGIISGYPIGAKTAADLYNQSVITKKEAESLLCFCNNSGPLFIIGALGVGMLSSKDAGIFLYIIHVVSAITLGIILRFTIPSKRGKRIDIHTDFSDKNIFTASVESSILSVINVFAYVIFFAIIMNVCEASSIFIDRILNSDKFILTKPLLFSIFEMTSGIKKLSAAQCSLSIKLILSSLILGWSGLSIHFQTKSIVGSTDLSFKKYILAKLLHGIIAAIYTAIALKFVPFEKLVFSNNSDIISVGNNTSDILHTATMIIMCIYIIVRLRLKYSNRYSKPKRKITI